MSHKSWEVGGGMRGLEGGQEQDWDWRSNMKRSGQEVMNKGQWSVRNIGVIGRSGECQDEEEKGEKGDIIAMHHSHCIELILPGLFVPQ